MELLPMNGEQFASFRSRSIADFAEEKVEAGTWAPEEALERAEESYERYLPQGLETPGAYVYNVVHPVDGIVGYIWFNVTENRRGKEAFCWILWWKKHIAAKGTALRQWKHLNVQRVVLGWTALVCMCLDIMCGQAACIAKWVMK